MSQLHPRVLALFATGTFLVAILAVSAWSFVNPPADERSVRLDSVDHFELGSVTPYRIDGRIQELRRPELVFGSNAHGLVEPRIRGEDLLYVVRLPDGDFRVLSGRSTHLGQVIEWRPDFEPDIGSIRGAFFGWGSCPLWAIDGTRIFGPAPRDMDRYDWHLDDGFLVVDISERHEGESQRVYQDSRVALSPYDVLDPGWATSGWPGVSE